MHIGKIIPNWILTMALSSTLGGLHLSDNYSMSSRPLGSSVPRSSGFAYSATEKYSEDFTFYE